MFNVWLLLLFSLVYTLALLHNFDTVWYMKDMFVWFLV